MASIPFFKKTYLYTFFPTKLEEQEFRTSSHLQGHRTLVEIRDVYPIPINPYNGPWQIQKLLSTYEIVTNIIILSFADTFDHILRYWDLFMASNVTVYYRRVPVAVWDVTDERSPKRYEGNDVFFQMTPNREHGILSCTRVMRDMKLKVNDCIGLYWHPKDKVFVVKLLYDTAVVETGRGLFN